MKFSLQRATIEDRNVSPCRPATRSEALNCGEPLFGAWCLALLVLAPSPAVAAGSQVELTVSATVLKHASLHILSQPTSVVITQADVARGYVDVPVSAQVAVKSNSPKGYMLEFAGEGGFYHRFVVRGLGSDVQIGPGGGAVMQPAAVSGVTRTTLDLGFRFLLTELTQPGTYSWPVHLSVAPV